MALWSLYILVLAGAVQLGSCPLNCKPELECNNPDGQCPECEPAYLGPMCEERVECVFDTNGVGYRGKRNTTRSGIGCKAWSDSKSLFVDEEENYCRNPDNDTGGPWCFTLDPHTSLEYCEVPECDSCPLNCKPGLECSNSNGLCPECEPAYSGPMCEERVECVFDTIGVGYRGKRNTTRSGIGCKAWSDSISFVDEEENYCRNPINDIRGPWCYTLDPHTYWEYCGVPECGSCPLNCKPGLECNNSDGLCPECEPAYSGPMCEERVECVFDTNGVGYRGKRNTTRSGIGCQAWSSHSPHGSSFVDEEENYCRNPDNKVGGPWCYTLDPEERWEFCGVPECGSCPLNCKPGLECNNSDGLCPECEPAYSGPMCEERVECVFDTNGVGYRGKRNTTRSGIGCQAWSSHSPHGSSFVDEEENYCRNPDNKVGGPWCYTLDPEERWEFCGVPECGSCPLNCKPGLECNNSDGLCPECEPAYSGPMCEERVECVFDTNGVGYRGKRNTTRSGIGCQAWSSHSPHRSNFVDEEENYCRNPDNKVGGPWCYTLDPEERWEFCGVPECGSCPLNCKPGLECNNSDGLCPECEPPYSGPMCEERSCPLNCKPGLECNNSNGLCPECEPAYSGPMCEEHNNDGNKSRQVFWRVVLALFFTQLLLQN